MANDCDRALRAGLNRKQGAMQSVDVVYFLIVETNYRVAFLQSRFGCGAARLNSNDEDGAGIVDIMESDQTRLQRNILRGYANPTAAHVSVTHERNCHGLRCVDGDGQADALRRQNYGGIDTNDFAAGID